MMNILLVGYYGHGNFGDDVLFLATLGLVRRLWPEATLSVQTEAKNPSYLADLAGVELPVVRMGERMHFNLVLHGGGGNFFDFANGRARDLILNRGARALGPRRFARLVRGPRALVSRQGITARCRIGLGLGIGTYTPTARRLRYELPVLASMRFLGVRDQDSIDNLRAIGIGGPVEVTSDLAFAGGWGEAAVAPSFTGPLVAVLRDWKDDDCNRRQLDAVRAIAAARPLRVLLFDEAADCALRQMLGDFPVDTYQPGRLDPIIKTLASAAAIVTARAHGAICGAILGVPSLLLPIEPKLASIHRILPRSTILSNWSKNISVCLDTTLAIDRETIATDVAENQAKLGGAIERMRRSLDFD